MDCSMRGGCAEDGDFSWSDSQSLESEENARLHVTSPRLWSTSHTMTRMDGGQLSPISTEIESPVMDRPPGSVDIPPMIHSSLSSRTNSWSTTYSEIVELMGESHHDGRWEQDSDDVLTVPKLEPAEEDEFHLDEVDEAPRSPVLEAANGTDLPAKTKRPRGRPRKHPVLPQTAASKSAKGRSKTGCITCRKRKKKCDEAKPRCMNCEKNAVVCEGYNAKTIWKSGRERAEEEKRQRLSSHPGITLQPIFRGVETPDDRVFFNHYINELSGVLTVENEHRNAFKDMLLRMSVEHNGLMHSILSLASSHMDLDTPYGRKVLSPNSKVTRSSLLERSEFHRSAAMESIQANITREVKNEPDQKVNLCLRYGQMLCLLLQTLAEGTSTGEHRVHLQAYKHLIKDSPPEDSEFLVFITEYFQFHVYADELIRYPDAHAPRLATEDWTPWVPIQPTRLIGVGDGLFRYLCHITSIRNTIRANINARNDPIVDYTSLYRAAEIDEAIRDWDPQWPPGDTRDRVALVYKQMMWIYLFRTIYPPTTSAPNFLLGGMSGNSAMSTESQPISPKTPVPRSMCTPPPSARPGSTSHDVSPSTTARADSPPPIRYPPHHDHRITLAVDESLTILESFKPSDPVQALLLTPSLVIGCACFAPHQRDRLRVILCTIRGYTGMRNGDRVRELLEEVWRLMEQGDWVSVWDWQGVARNMGLDFSCA